MTCHHPSAGFADPENRVAPTVFPVSDGSTPTDFGGRNAPTASYMGFSPVFHLDETEGLYVGGAFWDGRATGLTLEDPLAEQALGPFLNPVEMGLSSKEEVIAIVQLAEYANLFARVFGPEPFTDVEEAYNNIGRAIAAFERSQRVTRFSSKFDRFWREQGKDVSTFGTDENGNYRFPKKFKSRIFSQRQAEGLALFNAADKGNCAACHLTENHLAADGTTYPPLFTDFTYDNLGIPVNPQIAALAGTQQIDYGLGARTAEIIKVTPADTALTLSTAYSGSPDGGDVSIIESEAGKFKVSSLRNVARTAPYGHNGYFATLREITHFYNTRDVEPWPAPEVDLNVNHDELGNLGLTAKEEAAIVAFMKTLTD